PGWPDPLRQALPAQPGRPEGSAWRYFSHRPTRLPRAARRSVHKLQIAFHSFNANTPACRAAGPRQGVSMGQPWGTPAEPGLRRCNHLDLDQQARLAKVTDFHHSAGRQVRLAELFARGNDLLEFADVGGVDSRPHYVR